MRRHVKPGIRNSLLLLPGSETVMATIGVRRSDYVEILTQLPPA